MGDRAGGAHKANLTQIPITPTDLRTSAVTLTFLSASKKAGFANFHTQKNTLLAVLHGGEGGQRNLGPVFQISNSFFRRLDLYHLTFDGQALFLSLCQQ